MEAVDLLIVGGGINGVGIARDAAGRGLSVFLAEERDLGGATSSASSKLIHGGLRYLEHLAFRLVAESLAEREVLLRTAPHLVRPMRFIMPRAPGLRPGWVLRTGLLLYDRLAGRKILERSAAIDLTGAPYRPGLKADYVRGYAYSDCRVDDARLVIANAMAAAEAGATVLPRTACVAARRDGLRWRATLADAAGKREVSARVLVNATGPWVSRFLAEALGEPAETRLKLVQGSHIVVPRLYEGDFAYILQNDDRRVVFVYAYEGDHTLIGTTDLALEGEPRNCSATAAEIEYLCRAANRYFTRQIGPADVKWSYCGVRALVDDGATEPSKLTRDYVLQLDGGPDRAPVLSVYGGKITTYRRLAERVLVRLAPWFPGMGPPWTAHALLPGGEVPGGDPVAYALEIGRRYPGLPQTLIRAIVHRHGSRTPDMLGTAHAIEDLGTHFGAGLYAREVDYFRAREWALDADDVLWRRTKAGLHLDIEQQTRLAGYMATPVG